MLENHISAKNENASKKKKATWVDSEIPSIERGIEIKEGNHPLVPQMSRNPSLNSNFS